MKTPRNQARERVLAALPGTQAEIHDKSGVSQAAISRWTIYLRSTNEAHIGGWRESISNKGLPQPVYHAGPGLDVPCETRVITPDEDARRKRGVEMRTKGLEERKARRQVDRVPARCDLTSALFGPA